jgi:hypothetical protein
MTYLLARLEVRPGHTVLAVTSTACICRLRVSAW